MPVLPSRRERVGREDRAVMEDDRLGLAARNLEGQSVSREVDDRSAGLGGFDTVQPATTCRFRTTRQIWLSMSENGQTQGSATGRLPS